MKVGMLGLGRLGLPVAAVLSQHHDVTGFDPDPSTASRLVVGHPWEDGLTEMLGWVALTSSAEAAVAEQDVVVICVQTPHEPDLDGTHPDNGVRFGFDTTYLETALRTVGVHGPPVVVMSTLLPGDSARLAKLVSDYTYAPAFPAMGTVVRDLLDPEFVLYSGNRPIIEQLFGFIDAPFLRCDLYETAELAKVAYNTAIGMKIALANTIGWLSHEVGADADQVANVLTKATRRIVSDAYLRPGLGDGGACHPRDQIAMSWLARNHGVYDIFSALIDHREQHSRWVTEIADSFNLPTVILGSAYKPNSTLDDGSVGLLMANMGYHITDNPDSLTEPTAVILAVPHTEWEWLDLPEGSVLIDPWGHAGSNVPVVRPGRKQRSRGRLALVPNADN